MSDLGSHRRSDSWFPDEKGAAHATRRATGDDVERALGAAEKLLAEGLDESRHLQNLRFAAVSFFIVTIVSLGGLAVGFFYEARLILAFAFVLGLPVAFVLLRLAVRPSYRESTEIAAHVASMVGEVITDVAVDEDWSELRLETTRLRLSAFPIVTRRYPEESGLAEVEQLFGDRRRDDEH